MPEAPEVWILCEAIHAYYLHHAQSILCIANGKHLLVHAEDWSFGLYGKVHIHESNGQIQLTKVQQRGISGDIKAIDYTQYETLFNLQNMTQVVDWFRSPKEQLERFITCNWKTSNKRLGTLLLNQHNIQGIGLAWGCEILHEANLRPDGKASDQDLSTLADAMITVRRRVKQEYSHYLDTIRDNKDQLQTFINDWYSNLYAIRTTRVYKTGTPIKLDNRTWYI